MVPPEFSFDMPGFATNSGENNLPQLDTWQPRSLLPTVELTGAGEKGVKASVVTIRDMGERSAEIPMQIPNTSPRQRPLWSYADYARDTEQERMEDDERIKRIIRATSAICAHSNGHSFTRDFKVTLEISGAASDECPDSSDAESLSKPPPLPVVGSPRLHRSLASRELRKLARISAQYANSPAMESACGKLKNKLFHGKREPPKVTVTNPAIKPQGQNMLLETINPFATPEREVDEDERSDDGQANTATPYSRRVSQIGVALPLDENTGSEPAQYLYETRSNLDDRACWFGHPTKTLLANLIGAATPLRAVETATHGPGQTSVPSIMSSSPSRAADKTMSSYRNVPFTVAASNSGRDGSKARDDTTDNPHNRFSSISRSLGADQRVTYSHLVDKPSKDYGNKSSIPFVANPTTTPASSTPAVQGSKNVWEGPYDLGLLIDRLDKIVKTNTNSPILIRFEPEMVELLEGSHLYLEPANAMSTPRRLPPGKAAQEAVRSMVPANRQMFVEIFAAVLIAQDTLSVLQMKAMRDPIGPTRLGGAATTPRGFTIESIRHKLGKIDGGFARAKSIQHRLGKIDRGLEDICHEIMQTLWYDSTKEVKRSLHAGALAAVRDALRS